MRNLALTLPLFAVLGCGDKESDGSDTVADADTDADTDSDTDADTDTDTDADTDTDTDADTDTDVTPVMFNFTWSTVEFNAHDGQPVRVAVSIAANPPVFVAEMQGTPVGGAMNLDFGPILIENNEYFIDYYADYNVNGTCEAPPDDHVWHVNINPVVADVLFPAPHDTMTFDARGCQPF